MRRILVHYVLSAAGVALLLLLLNLVVLAAWVIESNQDSGAGYRVSQVAESLEARGETFELVEPGASAIGKSYAWAMLLNDEGDVIWGRNLPADLPRHFTVGDVASFTRWYLLDYPVQVWRHPQGLLVLASAQDSVWKFFVEMPTNAVASVPTWLGRIVLANCLGALLIASLTAVRLHSTLHPISEGIEEMAENRPVELSSRGYLGDLAGRLNKTSQQLQAQEQALAHRDSARTTWIAAVSHDIRTPLSIVMGYASDWESDQTLSPQQRDQARRVRQQSEQIEALVSDLSLASKLIYAMQPLRLEVIHLGPLARGVAADFVNGGLADGYEIEVLVADQTQDLAVRGDRILLRRALANLVLNSIRHNPGGGKITIRVGEWRDDATLSVADDGVGFSDERLQELARPQDADELPARSLGLTIVRQVVAAHDGRVSFSNLCGGGGLVELYLPRVR